MLKRVPDAETAMQKNTIHPYMTGAFGPWARSEPTGILDLALSKHLDPEKMTGGRIGRQGR